MANSLLALIDDIASMLDDVAVLTKVAAKKTSGVIGDDLAVNVNQVSGVSPDKELPVIFAVAKGAFLNKLILVPLALLLSFFLPGAIHFLLMFGGAFLCFEGAEKVLEKLHLIEKNVTKNLSEEERIKGAIRTDFILSAEIIILSLDVINQENVLKKILSLSTISILMTVGVYGIVALLVKLDDIGLFLYKTKNAVLNKIGKMFLILTPKIMKILGVVGTVAMFLVGGNIIVHSVPYLGKLTYLFSTEFKEILSLIYEGLSGIIVGIVIVFLLKGFKKIFN